MTVPICWHAMRRGPMRLLYASELAYYLATIMMLALWEVPRKDYHVMMTHHFATVVLITCSYKYKSVAGWLGAWVATKGWGRGAKQGIFRGDGVRSFSAAFRSCGRGGLVGLHLSLICFQAYSNARHLFHPCLHPPLPPMPAPSRSYTRVGCVIMLLHDINDVLMETAKSLNYARFDLAATTIFASFVASWAGLRIYAFPAYIIRSTLLEVTHELGYRPPHYLLMNALLLALYAIHLYWFCLILRIAWIKLTTGQAKDIREDDDDGSDED